MQSPDPNRRSGLLVAAAATFLYVILAAHNIWRSSATVDELLHLSSGWTALHWGDFRLNPEHPPLAKMLAALPVRSWLPLLPPGPAALPPADAQTSWQLASTAWDEAARSDTAQWYFSHFASHPLRDSWLASTGVEDPRRLRTDRLVPPEAWAWSLRDALIRARLALLVFPLSLIVILLAWGRRLATLAAGVAAVLLLVLDPSFLAHGGLVTTDVPVAVAIFASIAALESWLRRPTLLAALALGLATGIALSVKFTAVALAPLMLMLVGGWLVAHRTKQHSLRAGGALAIALAGALVVIWTSYGFAWGATGDDGPRKSIEPLLVRRAAVASLIAAGEDLDRASIEERSKTQRVDGWIDASLWRVHETRLLPKAWTYGLAAVRAGAAPRTAFLNGRYSEVGFPSYFAWTFLYKTPPAALLALLITVLGTVRGWVTPRQLWWLGVPAVFLFVVASSSGVNIGHRHLLVIYPFLWMLAGIGVVELARRVPNGRALALALLVLGVVNVFVVLSVRHGVQWLAGHHLSYMNEIAGGPLGGSDKLSDSNLDWGQDACALADWWREQESPPLLAYAATGATDPRAIGLPVINTTFGYPFAPVVPFDQIPPGALLALGRTSASGILDDYETRKAFAEYLGDWRLVDRVGYGIEIYARK